MLAPVAVLAFVSGCTGEPRAEAGAETEGGESDESGESGESGTGADTGETGVDAAPTYWKDTKLILDAACVSCHRAGEVAPFTLEGWDEVQNFAPVLAGAISDRSMPPWPPRAGCNEFANDRSLGEEEREILLDWIDQGYPEGDPADAPPEPELPEDFEPDFSVQLPVPYTPNGELDDYRCFTIPWPESLTEDSYVVGQEVIPDQRDAVHHVITYVAGPGESAFYQNLDDADPEPGYTCFGGPGKLDWSARWLGDWVPGAERWLAPAGTGVRVEAGSLLVVQIHYNNAGGEPLPDQTRLDFQVVDEVEHVGEFVPIVNYGWITGSTSMSIPAGAPDTSHSVTLGRTDPLIQFLTVGLGVAPNETVDVWRAALHMHTLGTRAELTLERAEAEDECMLGIDDWDFNWQGDYLMREPQAFGPGDAIRLECHWDNSAGNQPMVDGQPKVPTDVGWGDGTFDEMCLGIVYLARR